MRDEPKAKEQLINELAELRQRIAELEAIEPERKWAEEALRLQSEIAANMAEGVQLTRTSDGVIVYANPRFEEMFGYAQGELIGKHVSVLNAPSDKSPEETAEEIIKSLSENGVWYGEVHNIKKDGTPFWCRASVSSLEHPQHEEVWVAVHEDITERKRAEEELSQYRDHLEDLIKERTAELAAANEQLQQEITERKRVEEALRESEEQLRKIVENMPVLFDAFDENGIALFWNKECERVTGYKADEIVGNPKSMELLVPDPKYRAWILEQLQMLGHNYRDWELEVRCKNGETRTIAWSNISRDYLIPGWWSWGIGVDITERKRAEEEIRQRTAQLEALRQVSLQLTAQLDLDVLLRSIVSRAIELLGGTSGGLYLYRPEQDVLEWAVTIGPDLIPTGTVLHRDEGLAGRVWETGEPLIVDDYQHWEGRPALHEAYPWTAVVGVPVRWGEELLGVLNVNTYPTGTFSPADAELLSLFATQAAIAIRNARFYEQAQRDAATKSMLLREVNHRVKNNLMAIIGLLYAEQRRAGMEDQAVYQSTIQNLANRVQSLTRVHSLLSASEWAPLPLSKLTTQVINSSFQMLPPGKRVSVDVTPSPVRVTSDQVHNLALVISELATNTAKHALQERNTAQITVRIALDDDTVLFEYRDDGPGYPEEVLQLAHHNVGFDLMQKIVGESLGGELSLHNDHGAVAVIQFKAKA